MIDRETVPVGSGAQRAVTSFASEVSVPLGSGPLDLIGFLGVDTASYFVGTLSPSTAVWTNRTAARTNPRIVEFTAGHR
ncbi:hypothetical protein [Rhodococcus artemisiae]|uniref:Uncharacterized protein n=1 Tax=Rhodococcus artemisiae TaxID=714159 RepID=A0ABU7L4Y2_9NOCA|nr:hypothetical protein [Rhodococcus artemisiae]MEE2056603.1 hypothetical protein [Rhodococcus artemisiae]